MSTCRRRERVTSLRTPFFVTPVAAPKRYRAHPIDWSNKMEKKSSPRLGDRVIKATATQGPPPVVFAVQPDSFIRVEGPEALRAWEEDVRKFLGIELRGMVAGAATECCSNGCSDDCDIA